MKNCPKCSTPKELSEFPRNKGRKDGVGGYCKVCMRKEVSEWDLNNSEYKNEKNREWHRINKERSTANSKRWREANPEKMKELVSTWTELHPENRSHNETKRRVRGIVQFGQEGIKEFYKNRPEGYEVDHIVPLQGKQVSGLHVVWNLQYLPAIENRRKHNKF